MKEHQLLIVIATIGFSGLFTIYSDIKRQSPTLSPMHAVLSSTTVEKQPFSAKTSAQTTKINANVDGSDVSFTINAFSHTDLISIDFGNGSHSILEHAACQYYYQEPGIYEVKLYKNELLIHAHELEIDQMVFASPSEKLLEL